MSAVIGAIFTVIVFLSGFSFIMWEVTQYDSHQGVITTRNQLDQDQKNEILEISQPSTQGTTAILFNVTNQGSVTAHVVALWVTEYTGTIETAHFGPISNSTYINPSSIIPFSVSPAGGLKRDKSYMLKVVTERGNIATKGWASLSIALTIGYGPPAVYKNGIVTVSGQLTLIGLGGLDGKQINLFRSEGSDWVSIGTPTTTGGGYTNAWNVGSLSSGNYRLKANFSGDADYPTSEVVSDSIGVKVLPDPVLTVVCIPSVVVKNDTVTISGVLTSEGLGVAGKTVNIYRSSGANWVSIGSVQTSAGTGGYAFTWRVPTDLASGNYQFNATFNGDSQYPSCNTVTTGSLQVLDPSIGLTLLYYAPYVHRNENVTIYGALISQGAGVGSKLINLYRSSGISWVLIGTYTTSADGTYSYTWNVTDLSPGNYRLRANFTGDSYYPACLAESDYIVVQVPVTTLTLLYYPPTVHRNDNMTIYGSLTSDGLGLGSKQINLYRSSGISWVLIGTYTTSADGTYSYTWNVTTLAPGNYLLKANFTGDSYYPACSVQSDYITVPVPITALTLTYYPPVVYKNGNVTISGELTGDELGLGNKQLVLSWSNGSSWVQIGLVTTAASGAYSYAWNVTGLSAGNYRLRANFTGDSYYPACFVQSDSIGVQVLADAVPPGTGGGISVGPFVLLFTNQSFQYTSSSNPTSPTTPMSAFQMDNDGTNILFWIQIKNQASKPIQISSLSFFLVEVRDLTSAGVPGTSETERYFHIASNSSTSSSLQAFTDYSQTIVSNETATLKFGASSVGGSSFLTMNSGEPMHIDHDTGDDNWENLCWTFLAIFWRYEGEPNTFGQTITYVAIRTTA
jgi:5-hydroxyisourate hydrolase-like protein (transthyretin family)